MANLMHLVVSNYNKLLESNKDPMVDTWFLMGSPVPVLGILGAYLIFVLKLGPKMMANRPAFELKTVMILYNAFQVVFSIWLYNLLLKLDFLKIIMAKECNNNHNSPNPMQLEFSTAAWWYFFGKIIELLDTIFFVLRKKQDQVTFLHVYHHTDIAIFSWVYLKFLPGQQGVVMGVLNLVVHTVMYSYYLIAALGPSYRKYLWWKKYMTWMQLVQFVILLCYLTYLLVIDCSEQPKALTYFFTIQNIIFFCLFSDYYRKSYRTKTA